MGEGSTGSFASYKWTIFITMYLGYMLMFLDRKSFSFAMPAVIEEQGLDKDDLGLIMSSQLMAYSISKFLGGIATDVISPRLLFCSGLALSGITVIVFTMFSSKLVYAFLWFVLGFVQGGGWPSCGKILRKWFSPAEFGTFWSVLSTGMNVASSVGPILTTILIANSGWRQALQIFGTASLGMTAVCMFSMADSPEDVGLVAPYEVEKKEEKGYRKLVENQRRRGSVAEQLAEEIRKFGKPRGRGRGTWKDVIRSPLLWLLGLSYFVILMVRSAVQDWGQLYLIQNRNQSTYVASGFLSSLELGGIFGSIAAGYSADRAVSMGRSKSSMPMGYSYRDIEEKSMQWFLSQRDDTKGSPRLSVVMIFTAIAAFGLNLIIFAISETSSQLWISLVAFVFGVGIYGPIACFGVMAIESAPSHLSGTSNAIVGLFANIGGVSAGLPFSYLAEAYDWSGAFVILEVLCVITGIMMYLCRNVEYKMVPIKKKLQ